MKTTVLLRLSLAAALVLALPVQAETPQEKSEKAFQALQWHVGPSTENIGTKASIKLTPDLRFLDQSNTRKFLELTGNIPDSNHNLLMSEDWWSVFSFTDSGYVKDDEKIDADALLKQMKDNDEPANEERKRLGLGALYTDGWYVPPHYDTQTKRLEWGLKLHSDQGTNLNYTVRLLGRSGYMSATLVSSPEKLDADVKSFKKALENFDFNGGERYAEYKQGDRIAEIGLAALVAGGAAAIATKKGFWAVLGTFFAAAWKFIAAAVVGLGAWLKSFFDKKKS